MSDPQPSVEERLAELERIASYQKVADDLTWHPQGRRWRSKAELFGWPILSIAVGPDLARGEIRGHARGIIAIGDIATGVFALGGIARGIFALGGIAVGVITFGGLSLGLLAGIGGAAVSTLLAVGGLAVGPIAFGGLAIGYYAIGGGTLGVHVINGLQQDPQLKQMLLNWFGR